MATVSSLSTTLGRMLNDPNQEVFTQALKFIELNRAQDELVLSILKFSKKFNGIYDLLSEITEEETVSVGTSGADLNTVLLERHILRNGFINSRITINGEFKYPVRYGIDSIGKSENTFLKGSDEFPVCRIITNKYYIELDVGSYPINVTMWYIGQPYELSDSESGSRKTSIISTPGINIIMHDLLALIAKRNLLLSRGDQLDIQEANITNGLISNNILSLVAGQEKEPKSTTTGQALRVDPGTPKESN